MGLSTPQMITSLRKKLGVDSVELIDSDALLLLNQSFWQITDIFPFREKETEDTFLTIAAQRDYSLFTVIDVAFEAIRTVSYVHPDTLVHTPIKRFTLWEYEEESYNESAEAQGDPQRYFRHNDKLRLWPTPDRELTIVVHHLITLDDLDALGGDPTIPQSWHEIIVYGAAWRGATDYGDKSNIKLFQNIQANLINSAVPIEEKEEVDSKLASVDPRLPDVNWR